MTTYWDPAFMKHISPELIRTVVEVGARYGDESIMLSKIYPSATIYSFECNPLTLQKCKENLSPFSSIKFINCALGDVEKSLPFFSYMMNNDGASSLLPRIDSYKTQKNTGIIEVKTLDGIMRDNHISDIDLLCMDVQGYELNILKGCKERLKDIKFIIMEEPKPIINTAYLPKDIHSKYIGAPTSKEINEFMTANGFIEIERIQENMIEDNVLYKRVIP